MWLTHSMLLFDVCIRWLDQSRPIGTRLLRILNLGRRWVGLPGTPPASLGTRPRLVRLTACTALWPRWSASVWAFQVELGFACFVSTCHYWQLFKALVMFGSKVRLRPPDPDADRLKWSGCHFLCPLPFTHSSSSQYALHNIDHYGHFPLSTVSSKSIFNSMNSLSKRMA